MTNTEAMRAELKPCPFCSHPTAAKITNSVDFQDLVGGDFDESNAVFYAVVCDASKPNGPGGCGAMGGFAESPAAATTIWNARKKAGATTRAMSLPARIAELTAEHGSMRAVGQELATDVSYISRMAAGLRNDPNDELLQRMGLRKVVSFERIKP